MSRKAGYEGEEAAALFLQKQGYVILLRNYTIRGAEIDIIAEEAGCVVFVEVKRRGSLRHMAPRETVTPAKQRRICMAAMRWLQENGRHEAPVRFDIVEITPEGPTLLKAAFDATAL